MATTFSLALCMLVALAGLSNVHASRFDLISSLAYFVPLTSCDESLDDWIRDSKAVTHPKGLPSLLPEDENEKDFILSCAYGKAVYDYASEHGPSTCTAIPGAVKALQTLRELNGPEGPTAPVGQKGSNGQKELTQNAPTGLKKPEEPLNLLKELFAPERRQWLESRTPMVARDNHVASRPAVVRKIADLVAITDCEETEAAYNIRAMDTLKGKFPLSYVPANDQDKDLILSCAFGKAIFNYYWPNKGPAYCTTVLKQLNWMIDPVFLPSI